jgi:hypothetical protein
VKAHAHDAGELEAVRHVEGQNDFQRVPKVIAEVVEQHITKPAAQNHAQHDKEQQALVVVVGEGHPALLHGAAHKHVAQHKAEHVGHGVPANLERPDVHQRGVDVRVGQHAASKGSVP